MKFENLRKRDASLEAYIADSDRRNIKVEELPTEGVEPVASAVSDWTEGEIEQVKGRVIRVDSEPIALFDLDGTLADFDGAMTKAMVSLASDGEPPWDTDRFAEDAEPPYLEARRRLIKQIPGFWANLPCLDDGFYLFRKAEEYGYRNMVLSRGPRKNGPAWGEKLDWCRNNLPEACQVTLTEDKGLVYGRVLVDDWPIYILRWLEWRKRGLVIMPARRWNKDFTHPQVIRFEMGVNDQQVAAALKDCSL